MTNILCCFAQQACTWQIMLVVKDSKLASQLEKLWTESDLSPLIPLGKKDELLQFPSDSSI